MKVVLWQQRNGSGVAQWLSCWAHHPDVRGSKSRSAIRRPAGMPSLPSHSHCCGCVIPPHHVRWACIVRILVNWPIICLHVCCLQMASHGGCNVCVRNAFQSQSTPLTRLAACLCWKVYKLLTDSIALILIGFCFWLTPFGAGVSA